MSTFSQVVDELVLELLRPDLRITITSYVNLVIREVHFQPNNQLPILFGSNRKEDEGLIAVEPAIWPIPSVPKFQRLETLYYNELGVYAKERSLARAYELDDGRLPREYWYRSGPNIVMSGIFKDMTYKLSYFEFPRTLIYYPVANRPATWNEEDQDFEFLPAYDSSQELREEAIELTSNWILARWKETVKQGVRTKVFVRLGESDRARLNYSLFEQMRMQLVLSESLEQTVDYT